MCLHLPTNAPWGLGLMNFGKLCTSQEIATTTGVKHTEMWKWRQVFKALSGRMGRGKEGHWGNISSKEKNRAACCEQSFWLCRVGSVCGLCRVISGNENLKEKSIFCQRGITSLATVLSTYRRHRDEVCSLCHSGQLTVIPWRLHSNLFVQGPFTWHFSNSSATKMKFSWRITLYFVDSIESRRTPPSYIWPHSTVSLGFFNRLRKTL